MLDRCVDNFFAETEQVAFCTQNIVPGIDFSNDPLLQGRNFSYLDTQLKRLGRPELHAHPDQRAEMPVPHFQQDGHMAMLNPKGRANYEPNSWGADGGPRESPETGFRSFAAQEKGTRRAYARRPSPTTTARPASSTSARPRSSRTTSLQRADLRAEQGGDAGDPRRGWSRICSTSTHALAEEVAEGLRLKEMPKPAAAAKPTRQDLKPSPTLEHHQERPEEFCRAESRRWSPTASTPKCWRPCGKALKAEGAMLKLVAPEVGGVKRCDGTLA